MNADAWNFALLAHRRACAAIALRNNTELLTRVGCGGMAAIDHVIRTGNELCWQIRNAELAMAALTYATLGHNRGGLS